MSISRALRLAPAAAPVALAALTAVIGLLLAEITVAVRGQQWVTGPGLASPVVVEPAGIREDDALRLVVLGDSQVAGVGTSSVDDALPAQLAGLVAEELARPVELAWTGWSGARTDDVTQLQVPRRAHAPADVVVVVVGANDATHLTPPWRMAERTTRMLTTARSVFDAPVVLAGVPAFTAPLLRQPLRAAADAYADVLRERQRAAATHVEDVVYVDVARRVSPTVASDPAAISGDGFHPSGAGYRLLAQQLSATVVSVVRDGGY